MLVDDNADDNFFHARVINKSNSVGCVVVKQSARAALDYLQSSTQADDSHPDLIFLDINMPGMNGWEFLEEYKMLDEKYKSHTVVVMLTTSDNPDHILQSNTLNIAADYKTKPLTLEMLQEVIDKYFP